MAAASSIVDQEKLLRHMSYEGHMRLSLMLGPSCASGNNYKVLASKLGFTTEEIRDLERQTDPVMYMLKKPRLVDLKISKLKSLLKEMERFDVVEDLKSFEGKTVDSCFI